MTNSSYKKNINIFPPIIHKFNTTIRHGSKWSVFVNTDNRKINTYFHFYLLHPVGYSKISK